MKWFLIAFNLVVSLFQSTHILYMVTIQYAAFLQIFIYQTNHVFIDVVYSYKRRKITMILLNLTLFTTCILRNVQSVSGVQSYQT